MASSPGNILYVGNLPINVKYKSLKKTISEYGKLKKMVIRHNSLKYPYALCTYASKSDAETAMHNIREKLPPFVKVNFYQEKASTSESSCSGSTKSTQLDAADSKCNEDKYDYETEMNLIKSMMDEIEKITPSVNQCFDDITEKNSLECLMYQKVEVKTNEKVTKKSFEKELFSAKVTKDKTISMFLRNKLTKNRWVVAVLTLDTKDIYSPLLSEFSKCCTDIFARDAKLEILEDEMVAVEIQKEWYRAYLLPNKFLALIDDGRTVKLSDTSKVIQCPYKFVEIPAFCCILQYNKSVNKTLNATKPLKCNINPESTDESISNVTIRIASEAVKAILEPWDPIAEYYYLLDEAEVVMESKPEKENRLVLTYKNIMRIVHFENFTNIYIADVNFKIKRLSDLQLQEISEAAETAPKLKNAPREGDFVLCIGIDEINYCRATVINSSPEIDLFIVKYTDTGETAEKKLEDLLECSTHIKNLPLFITKVKLEGFDEVTPTVKVLEYFDKLITKGVHLECTFNCENIGVIFMNEEKSINSEIKSLTKPIVECIKGSVIEQPVFFSNSIDVISFDDLDVSASRPQLIVTCKAHLKVKTLICKLNDKILQKKFTALEAEMNKYCESQVHQYLPRINEICLAISNSDNLYHRAVVLDYLETRKPPYVEDNRMVYVMDKQLELVVVLFIDTGAREKVEIKDIRKILEYFITSIPQQVNPCYLLDLPATSQPEMFQKIREFLERENNMLHVTYIKCLKNEYRIRVPALQAYLQ